MKRYYRALTIATTDSGGGAGVQADLKTFSALGCYGTSAIAALTAQNTRAVNGVFPVDPEFLAAQIDTIMEDIGTDAVKIGMLFTADAIRTTAERLHHHRLRNIVLDPVMVAKSGDSLLRDDAIEVLRTVLLPLATVVTPNLPEASVLLGTPVERLEDMESACRALSRLGPDVVLLKGGHLAGSTSPDMVFVREGARLITIEAPRIETQNTHGTGCTLSSAVAAHLARGFDPVEAIRQAKSYLTKALRAGAGYALGSGHGPVHHHHAFWE